MCNEKGLALYIRGGGICELHLVDCLANQQLDVSATNSDNG